MGPKDSNNCLRDVSNIRTSSHSSPIQGNVFKRLGASPSMRFPNDLSKPPGRVSPLKRSPMKPPLQVTPKRIRSPEYLREYQPKLRYSGGSPSTNYDTDFKVENRDSTTSVVLPTSPNRTMFSNERKIGGDGSLGKIRSRFSNGLLSPKRRMISTPMKSRVGNSANNNEDIQDNCRKELQGRNLFEELKEAEKMENGNDEQNRKTVQPNKKTVKFELPQYGDSKEEMKRELQELKGLLEKIAKHHIELECRLSRLEKGQE